MARLNWGKRFGGMSAPRTESKDFASIPEIEAKERGRQLRQARRMYAVWTKRYWAVLERDEKAAANALMISTHYRDVIRKLGGHV